jgi:hypothetical protein
VIEGQEVVWKNMGDVVDTVNSYLVNFMKEGGKNQGSSPGDEKEGDKEVEPDYGVHARAVEDRCFCGKE